MLDVAYKLEEISGHKLEEISGYKLEEISGHKLEQISGHKLEEISGHKLEKITGHKVVQKIFLSQDFSDTIHWNFSKNMSTNWCEFLSI